MKNTENESIRRNRARLVVIDSKNDSICMDVYKKSMVYTYNVRVLNRFHINLPNDVPLFILWVYFGFDSALNGRRIGQRRRRLPAAVRGPHYQQGRNGLWPRRS